MRVAGDDAKAAHLLGHDFAAGPTSIEIFMRGGGE